MPGSYAETRRSDKPAKYHSNILPSVFHFLQMQSLTLFAISANIGTADIDKNHTIIASIVARTLSFFVKAIAATRGGKRLCHRRSINNVTHKIVGYLLTSINVSKAHRPKALVSYIIEVFL